MKPKVDETIEKQFPEAINLFRHGKICLEKKLWDEQGKGMGGDTNVAIKKTLLHPNRTAPKKQIVDPCPPALPLQQNGGKRTQRKRTWQKQAWGTK